MGKNNKGILLLGMVWQTLSDKFSLSWSHYVVLLTINSPDERRFYEIEAIENAWGIRELKRQINSSLYERLALSRNKKGVKELARKGQFVARPSDVLKNPYVLEFLGLQEKSEYSEHDTLTLYGEKITRHFPCLVSCRRASSSRRINSRRGISLAPIRIRCCVLT